MVQRAAPQRLTGGELQAYWERLSNDHLASSADGFEVICYAGMPDWFNRFMHRYQVKAFERLLASEPFAGCDVLDLGTGVGRWARWFASAGASVVGIDIESDRVERARFLGGGPRYEVMRADWLRFPANSFDVVNSVTVLQHIPDDTRKAAIAEIARVLRPGGRAILFETTDIHDDAPHVFPWTRRHWEAAFAQHGLTLRRTVGDQYTPLIRLIKKIHRLSRGAAARSELDALKAGRLTTRSRLMLTGLHGAVLASYPIEEAARFLPSRAAAHYGLHVYPEECRAMNGISSRGLLRFVGLAVVALAWPALRSPAGERGALAATAIATAPAPPMPRLDPVVAPSPAAARAVATALSSALIPTLALASFLMVFVGVVWTWSGVDPLYFPSPDEAVNRVAAQRVADTGSPRVPLDVADDEDLRHARTWISIDGGAIPVYPPAAYYLQGAMLRVPYAGNALVAALPALGIAAFVAGVAMLGAKRRAVAFLAPAMAFPALYWMMRPWTNLATLLAFLGIALFCWASWRAGRRLVWLVLAASSVGVAAAVRPDYALYILSFGLLCTLAESRKRELPQVLALALFAAVVAVGLNLVLDVLTTGHPFTTAYQIADARRPVAAQHGTLPGPFARFSLLLMPEGVPSLSVALDELRRYWFEMGPIAGLAVAQAATVALLWRSRPRAALLFGAAAVASVLFMVSRMSADLYGGADAGALLRHSVPRYWTPVYLLAAVPPVLFIMHARKDAHWAAAATLCAVLALLGAREIYDQQPESLTDIRAYQTDWQSQQVAWSTAIPGDAVVYTDRLDKVLWSRWEVASLPSPDNPARLAASMRRTIDSGRPVYVIQNRWDSAGLKVLEAQLNARALSLRPGPLSSIYEVTRAGGKWLEGSGTN